MEFFIDWIWNEQYVPEDTDRTHPMCVMESYTALPICWDMYHHWVCGCGHSFNGVTVTSCSQATGRLKADNRCPNTSILNCSAKSQAVYVEFNSISIFEVALAQPTYRRLFTAAVESSFKFRKTSWQRFKVERNPILLPTVNSKPKQRPSTVLDAGPRDSPICLLSSSCSCFWHPASAFCTQKTRRASYLALLPDHRTTCQRDHLPCLSSEGHPPQIWASGKHSLAFWQREGKRGNPPSEAATSLWLRQDYYRYRGITDHTLSNIQQRNYTNTKKTQRLPTRYNSFVSLAASSFRSTDLVDALLSSSQQAPSSTDRLPRRIEEGHSPSQSSIGFIDHDRSISRAACIIFIDHDYIGCLAITNN